MKSHTGADRCSLRMPWPFYEPGHPHRCAGAAVKFSLRHVAHPICCHVAITCCPVTFNAIVAEAQATGAYLLNVPAICNCGCADTPPLFDFDWPALGLTCARER